jgi:hypothetical protein
MDCHAILSVALTLDCSALQKAAAQAASAVCAETRDTLEIPKVVRCGKLPAAGTTRHYGEATKSLPKLDVGRLSRRNIPARTNTFQALMCEKKKSWVFIFSVSRPTKQCRNAYSAILRTMCVILSRRRRSALWLYAHPDPIRSQSIRMQMIVRSFYMLIPLRLCP